MQAGTEENALLLALVCGYRHEISDASTYADFQTCGLAHVVAVSGMHLTIVIGLFAIAFKAMRVPRRLSVVALSFLTASYVVMAGMPVSALRAAVMTGLCMFSVIGRRRPFALNALGMAIAGMIVVSPQCAVSVAFALSVLSTAGILMFAPLMTAMLQNLPIVGTPFVSESLSLTLASSVLAQPLGCAVFHQVPLIAPIANVIVAPLIGPVCTLGLVSGVTVGAGVPFAGILVTIASQMAGLLGTLAGFLSTMPFASIPCNVDVTTAVTLSAGAALAIWIIWPRNEPVRIIGSLACVIAFMVVVFAPNAVHGDAIVMLDVGQGDAILISSRGHTVLVDTGNQDGRLLTQLASCGVVHLDAVVITHGDDDHCGSLDALERAVDVDRIMLASDAFVNEADANVRLVAEAADAAKETVPLEFGNLFNVGAFAITVIWPHGFIDDGGNADSICLLAEYDGDDDGEPDFTALLMGDAEHEQMESILMEQRLQHIDVLKVGHHGSREGMTEQQARRLMPRIALIGVGARNRYGHPAQETLDMLDAVGCRVFRTDLDGQVRCTFTNDSIAVDLQ